MEIGFVLNKEEHETANLSEDFLLVFQLVEHERNTFFWPQAPIKINVKEDNVVCVFKHTLEDSFREDHPNTGVSTQYVSLHEEDRPLWADALEKHKAHYLLNLIMLTILLKILQRM